MRALCRFCVHDPCVPSSPLDGCITFRFLCHVAVDAVGFICGHKMRRGKQTDYCATTSRQSLPAHPDPKLVVLRVVQDFRKKGSSISSELPLLLLLLLTSVTVAGDRQLSHVKATDFDAGAPRHANVAPTKEEHRTRTMQ